MYRSTYGEIASELIFIAMGTFKMCNQSYESMSLRGSCLAVSSGTWTTLVVALQVCRFVSSRLISRWSKELELMTLRCGSG
jgi:hypothetical protein